MQISRAEAAYVILNRIKEIRKERGRCLVAIDGNSGSGKSTLIKLVNDLLNVIIDIETNTGNVRLTTQQKELSDIRLSGIYASQYAGGYKNWHAENVEATLKALSEL